MKCVLPGIVKFQLFVPVIQQGREPALAGRVAVVPINAIEPEASVMDAPFKQLTDVQGAQDRRNAHARLFWSVYRRCRL